MKRSLVPRLNKELDPAKAGTFFLINQLVTPGAGSLMGGRRAGYPQLGLAFTGFFLVCGFFYGFLKETWLLGEIPEDFGGYGSMGVSGTLVFGLSWIWSLITSVSMWREAARLKLKSNDAKEPPPLPDLPPHSRDLQIAPRVRRDEK